MQKVIVTITNEVGDVLERETRVVIANNHIDAAKKVNAHIGKLFPTIDEQDELDAELAAEEEDEIVREIQTDEEHG